MAGETVITVIGNLTEQPDLKFTPAGVAVLNFSVASTPRVFDRATNEWTDADALFLRCTAWRELAENAAESLTRGARVIVSGRLRQRSWQTREGDKRTSIELDVDDIAPSLRWATASVNRTRVKSASRPAPAAADTTPDPWSVATEPAMAGVGAGYGDEPPF